MPLAKLRKKFKFNKGSILFNLFVSRQIWYLGDLIILMILAFLYNGQGIGTLGVSKGIAGAINTISSFGVSEAFGSKGHSYSINEKQARILNELELFFLILSLISLFLISVNFGNRINFNLFCATSFFVLANYILDLKRLKVQKDIISERKIDWILITNSIEQSIRIFIIFIMVYLDRLTVENIALGALFPLLLTLRFIIKGQPTLSLKERIIYIPQTLNPKVLTIYFTQCLKSIYQRIPSLMLVILGLDYEKAKIFFFSRQILSPFSIFSSSLSQRYLSMFGTISKDNFYSLLISSTSYIFLIYSAVITSLYLIFLLLKDYLEFVNIFSFFIVFVAVIASDIQWWGRPFFINRKPSLVLWINIISFFIIPLAYFYLIKTFGIEFLPISYLTCTLIPLIYYVISVYVIFDNS